MPNHSRRCLDRVVNWTQYSNLNISLAYAFGLPVLWACRTFMLTAGCLFKRRDCSYGGIANDVGI